MAKKFILLVLLLSGCTEKIDFKYFDSSGNLYTFRTISESFYKYYGIYYKPYVLLIETPDSKNKEFLGQIAVLSMLDTEFYNLIYITSNKKEVDKYGYHTKLNTARKLKGKYSGFRARLFDSDGNIIMSSKDRLSANSLQSAILRESK